MLLFIGSLAAALWLMRELVNVALGDGTRPAIIRSMVLMLVTVTLMTAMQQHARGAAPLPPAANPERHGGRSLQESTNDT